MNDGYDDRFSKKGDKHITPSNIKKIPKRKTAVALKESERGKNIPKLAAAGRGAIAEKILQLAYENGINVREDSNLAELLASIEIDSPIPSEAFIAVGEILSYIYRVNEHENPFDSLLNDDN